MWLWDLIFYSFESSTREATPLEYTQWDLPNWVGLNLFQNWYTNLNLHESFWVDHIYNDILKSQKKLIIVKGECINVVSS